MVVLVDTGKTHIPLTDTKNVTSSYVSKSGTCKIKEH